MNLFRIRSYRVERPFLSNFLFPENSKFNLENSDLDSEIRELLFIYQLETAYSKHFENLNEYFILVEREKRFRRNTKFILLDEVDYKYLKSEDSLVNKISSYSPDLIFPHKNNDKFLYSAIFLNGITSKKILTSLNQDL